MISFTLNMRIHIEPIQLSIVRTCNEMDLEVISCSPQEIELGVQFNCNGTGFYSCNIKFNAEEIESFYKDELDIMDWIIQRFNLTLKESFSLKRKEMEEFTQLNKKIKFRSYHRLLLFHYN